MRTIVHALPFALVLVAPLAGQSPSTDDAGKRWLAHVQTLADDRMEGRETGTPAFRAAADYVSSKFMSAGLEPAGESGYLQPIRFTSRRIVETQSSLSLVTGEALQPLTLGQDAYFSSRVDAPTDLDAPLVFVGYGISAPDAGHDDLAGLDVKGKVVVHVAGAPRSMSGPVAAHTQSGGARWEALRRAGALGIVTIPNPKTSDVPWDRASANRLLPALVIAETRFDDLAGQQLGVTLNAAAADRVFAGSGHTIAEVLALADQGQPLPRFPLVPAIRAHVTVETAPVESMNVAGIVRGSDPVLRDEYVVLSAHLDHLGVGAAIGGDRIYNGVMDNASGIATLLEVASELGRMQPRPRRSIVLVAVTGEEKGLLGSRYYAVHPTVPKKGIVANVNMDMFLPLFPLKTLMVLGLDESDLGTSIRRVAGRMDIAVQADPEPQRNRFIRSDQYSFIREGVPALAMKVGYEPGSPQAAIAAAWTKDRYHAPSDDLSQPLDLEAAVRFTRVIRELTVDIANAPARPRWNDDSFFRRFVRTTP